jgi:endonuclease/exonuclease/phosphatase family metal-dependent hydrolase/uncharacterized protein YgiM (DUF1202 family)
MKKALIIILIIAFAITLCNFPLQAHAQSINRGEITGSNVAMRKAAKADAPVITKLAKGTIIEILQTNVNAQWHKVAYNGKTGYVNRTYVSWDRSLKEYQLDYTGTVINCTKDVNVRSKPENKAKVVGAAKKGSILKVTAKDHTSGWHQVEFSGGTAYIASKYLDVSAKVDDRQLAAMSVKGGTISPGFSPLEYGYVVSATSARVTISTKANSGVKIDVNGTGKDTASLDIPSGGMKTVRIKLNGEIRYSVYIVRNLVTVGTWNIKRGYGQLPMQGRLVRDQQPDIMGIQEVFMNPKASDIVDNLASLKTNRMANTKFTATINYSNGSQYGIGLLSSYKIRSVQAFALDSAGLEKRVLQKAVVTISGKTVSVYNTHFSYNSASVREAQFAEVASIMKKDKNKYRILFGDFNAKINEFAQFKGYSVVNSSETVYYDYSKDPIANNVIDNIIVTSNIKVVNTRIIETSLSDHDPVFAYLSLR